MSVPLESVEVGKCYLIETGEVRQVVAVLLDGRVLFAHPPTRRLDPGTRLLGSRGLHTFSAQAVRQVPWDWTPERDETSR